MKQIIVRSAIMSILLAIVSEVASYFRKWRPDFFSFGELISIISFAAFLFIFVFSSYLLVVKLKKERGTFKPGIRIQLATLSLLISTTLIYFDDKDGLELSAVIGIAIYGLLIFFISSFIFLLAKRKL